MKDLRLLDDNRVRLSQCEALNKIDKRYISGTFDFIIKGKKWFVVASVNNGWQHVSISNSDGIMPDWEVMEVLKKKFFKEDEFAIEFHPQKVDYVNNVVNCLHLWLPENGEFPYPDAKVFKKSKPSIVDRRAISVDGEPYSYMLQRNEDFELLTIHYGFKGRPNWNAVCKIKEKVLGDTVAVSYHGRQGDTISKMNKDNEDTIYVWRALKEFMPVPPDYLVGIKELNPEQFDKFMQSHIVEGKFI